MAGGVIQWPTGEVRWGWHVAATVRDLRITIPRHDTVAPRTLRATIVTANRYQLRQGPLVLVVPFAEGGWPLHEVSIVEGTLTAFLGVPEASQ